MGGGTREQCGSNKAGSLKNLTIGLIWLVTRGGRRGGCGPGRRARGVVPPFGLP